MKKHIFAGVVLTLAMSSPALAQWVYPMRQVGKQTLTPAGASTAMTVPAGTRHITFYVRGAEAHLNVDGTAAVATDETLPIGQHRWWNDILKYSDVRFICTGCTIEITYWNRRNN